jgi:hypothetical protein
LQGNIEAIPEGTVDIPDKIIPDQPMAGTWALQRLLNELDIPSLRNAAGRDAAAY